MKRIAETMSALLSATRRLLHPALARAQAFARDERGVTAVEFGILALPFFTIILAILQTAMLFLSTQVLDSAVEDAARRVRTGEAQSYTIDQFRSYMCEYTFGLLGSGCTDVQIKVQVLSSFTNVTTAVPQSCNSTTCTWTSGWQAYDSGSASCRAVMQVSAYYRYPLIVVLPYFNLKNQPDNYRLIGGIRVFRNEPYGAC